MAELVVALLVALIAAQLPIAAFAYLDARRLGLKDPETYCLGILVPTGGFVVIPYYLRNRRDLPRVDPPDDAAEDR